MMKADEAKRITNEAIQKKKEEEKKVMETFLAETEKQIRENAEKGQTICYINIPKAFQYSEYKVIDALREYGYGAQFDCYDMMKVTW